MLNFFLDQNQNPSFNLQRHYHGSRPPVVFVLNWLGSEKRHVQKYVDLYRSLGFPAYAEISPRRAFVFEGFFGKSVHDRIITDIRSKRIRHKTDEVIFHCMSGNGFHSLAKIIQNEQHKLRKLEELYLWRGVTTPSAQYDLDLENLLFRNIRGIVFDSSPTPPTPDVFARGFSESFLKSNLLKKSSRFMAKMALKYCSSVIQNNARRIAKAMRGEHLIRCPQLYLYSRKDKLVSLPFLESFIESQEKLEIEVHRKVWDDSDHVQHYRKHPGEYKKAIKNFLSTCFQTDPINWKTIDLKHQSIFLD
ncbi:hypothetical protein M0812_15661 [Anaeramoeba flamelloides]|uniref:DUF829 domain-containing protein n=1 Tax=Anaeramoeba flamelloides TaxID=1746091 RepID=A0AAV7ZFW8_9EUKA|nr:hypothetical protein M0812_15661 [Anaeramoeba flamelloides]|eukprot:Anaeramoba_flamelloidesc41688_g1_i3.p1 GENE.c41688_g1_i3~~c41688_g1_i3.p1  ORF type:complete len:305 (-),score=55.57 c41688_g1_i3:125-1039(-)